VTPDLFAGRDVFLTPGDQSFTGMDAGSYDGLFANLISGGHDPPFDTEIWPDHEEIRSGEPQLHG